MEFHSYKESINLNLYGIIKATTWLNEAFIKCKLNCEDCGVGRPQVIDPIFTSQFCLLGQHFN